MRNDHQYKIVMVRRRWQRFTAAHADERLLYEVAETTTYYCTSWMAHRRGERRLRRNTVYGRHVTAPARRRRRRRRCTYTHSIYSIVRDGDVWEGRTCVYALMETTCVYGVSTNRSGVHEAMNVFVFSVSINVTYWYLYILHISFSKKIYSIFCTMRYTTYYPLFMILHTVILFLRGYSILYFFSMKYIPRTSYSILHFFRVTPYYIIGSSAYSILFCTLIYYEVHASWYFILHTPYSRTSYSI